MAQKLADVWHELDEGVQQSLMTTLYPLDLDDTLSITENQLRTLRATAAPGTTASMTKI